MFNGLFKGVVASSVNRGGTSFCVEYQNILNYATIQGYSLPTNTQQVYQNQLMEFITGSGLYTKLDILYVFKNNGGEEFSKINWINTSSFYANPTGSTLPTWDSSLGWSGNGTTGYIDTGYIPTNLGPQKFLQYDAGTFIYSKPNTLSLNTLIGYVGTGAGTLTLRVNGNNSTQNRIMTGLGTSGNIDFTGTGLKHVNSVGVNTQTYIKDGTLISTQLITSSSPSTITPISIFRSQNLYGDASVSIFGLGGNTTSYSSSLKTAIDTYLLNV